MVPFINAFIARNGEGVVEEQKSKQIQNLLQNLHPSKVLASVFLQQAARKPSRPKPQRPPKVPQPQVANQNPGQSNDLHEQESDSGKVLSLPSVNVASLPKAKSVADKSNDSPFTKETPEKKMVSENLFGDGNLKQMSINSYLKVSYPYIFSASAQFCVSRALTTNILNSFHFHSNIYAFLQD